MSSPDRLALIGDDGLRVDELRPLGAGRSHATMSARAYSARPGKP
jgi:hypothetical protein